MNIEIESELINYYCFYINVLVIQNLTSKLSTVVNPLQGHRESQRSNCHFVNSCTLLYTTHHLESTALDSEKHDSKRTAFIW